uniref:Myosin tail domain-containing protein n=1 Tax=Rhodnius prolixus TaxID=13249 RepID=T1I795_RHOPR
MPMTTSRSTKYTYRSTGGGTADVNIEYSADLSALSRLEDKIRLLSEDLESERELRQRIEREKADLSVQVIALQERLEEAEGGAESQFEINKKRDTELLKLRKLLEDVHLESEETAHLLRKKHQEVVVDFQEQLDQLTKAKHRAEKEKAKFQQEVYELLAQVENSNKDKLISIKHAEKLEITIHELNVRIEELNRTIVDITSHKTRLSQENIELTKEVQDLKVNIENATYLKTQIAGQLDDARRRLEEDERRRSTLEASLHQVEVELESVRVQLEEEAEARLDLERQLVKTSSDCLTWKSKYESEAAARTEEVEEIRLKYTIRLQEQEEHIETLIVKINNLEKQKSRLQSEVEVLIIDLEKANNTARELQKRVEQLERINIDMKTRLEETTIALDQAQRDLRTRATEIQRLNHELEKTREQKDSLTRENKKLADDLHDAKNILAEMNRRLHELEIELRRLENEREELSAAYKEAEAGRKAEEQRCMRLTAEFGQFRHEAEKRIAEKDEEIESVPALLLITSSQSRPEQVQASYINIYSANTLLLFRNNAIIKYCPCYYKTFFYKNNYLCPSLFVKDYKVCFYCLFFNNRLLIDAYSFISESLRNPNHFIILSWISYLFSLVALSSSIFLLSNRNDSYFLPFLAEICSHLPSPNSNVPKKCPINSAIYTTVKRQSSDTILRSFLRDQQLNKVDSKEIFKICVISAFIKKNIFILVRPILVSEIRSPIQRTPRGIKTKLLGEVYQNLYKESRQEKRTVESYSAKKVVHKEHREKMIARCDIDETELLKPLEDVRQELHGIDYKTARTLYNSSKQTSIEIEQLNARVAEAETKLKTEVIRIKKKLQVQITELELSLDVANKNNIQLQQTIKKQSLQLTELQAHYDETQRQLAVTMDQLAIATRKVQSLTAEMEEIRGNYEQALRGKRSAEQSYEDALSRINELTTINVNISAVRAKLEQELSTVASDYEEVTKELKIADERYQKVQIELKHSVEILHEEQERIIKIETIKKSLEIEVKNLSVRLEEVEANAIVGGKRAISKLEARIRDLELELDEEKRRHAESVKILRKKERSIKEIMIQCEEDHKNVTLLQEALDKASQKVSIYKRQLQEQEGVSQQSVTRVRRFQRELEAAEDRADTAESNLSLIRAKHRTFVTTSTVPGSQVYLVQETRTTENY